MIGVQVTVWQERKDNDKLGLKYELKTDLKDANAAQAAFLLAGLHIAEKRIIEFIDECVPEFRLEED